MGKQSTFLIRQHHTIRALFSEVADDWAGAAHRLRTARAPLAVHETADERIVHPLALMFGQGGDVVDHSLAEEREAKDTLRNLERMGPEALRFDALVAQCRGKVLTPTGHETDEFTCLRDSAPEDRLRGLVPALKALGDRTGR